MQLDSLRPPWMGALRLLLLLGLLAGAHGCVSAGRVPTTPIRVADSFSASGSEVVPDRWWLVFGDANLDTHVERALAGSFDLESALANLQAARALAQREASALFPDVDGRLTPDSTFQPGPDRHTVSWGLDVAYQVDLWGEIQARSEAAQLRADSSHEDYHAVALTLAAEVATTWYSLVEAHAQLRLLAEQIETNRKGVVAQLARFGRGFARSPDVLRQQQLVEATREQAVVVQTRIALLEHQLAILLGDEPQFETYNTGYILPSLPPPPESGIPSDLLARRPDVRRDFFSLRAADRDVASAVSAQYPRLDLSGSILNVAEHPDTLFRDWFASIASQLIAPLLDGGQRRAEVARTTAVARQRLQQYGQTILVALREVEDGLARERYQTQRIELIDAQLELAEQASEQLMQQYFIGDAAYLDVLSTIQAEQRLQRERLAANLESVLIRIQLYSALAGGFDTQPRTTPDDSVIVESPSALVLRQIPPLPTDTEPAGRAEVSVEIREAKSDE